MILLFKTLPSCPALSHPLRVLYKDPWGAGTLQCRSALKLVLTSHIGCLSPFVSSSLGTISPSSLFALGKKSSKICCPQAITQSKKEHPPAQRAMDESESKTESQPAHGGDRIRWDADEEAGRKPHRESTGPALHHARSHTSMSIHSVRSRRNSIDVAAELPIQYRTV